MVRTPTTGNAVEVSSKLNKVAQGLLAILAALLIFVTVLPLLPYNQWWIRMWDFPRLQILCLALLVNVFFVFLLRPWNHLYSALSVALFAAMAYQFSCIVPYTGLYPVEVESTNRKESQRNIRLFTSNVLMDNKNSEALLKLISRWQPDVILLTEVDERWMEEIAVLKSEYPHFVGHPLENAYGIALYSKLPLRSPKIRFLIEDDVPSIHTKIALKSGEMIEFYGIHPKPPAPQESDSTTYRDAELVVVAKEVVESNSPVIVAGDLNDVAWSRTTRLFQKISQTLDPRIGRGLFNTFHADYPFLRYPLDHIFHSSEFRIAEFHKLDHVGSDHFPVFVNLSLEDSASETQTEPVADPEENESGDEIVEEAREKKMDEEQKPTAE